MAHQFTVEGGIVFCKRCGITAGDSSKNTSCVAAKEEFVGEMTKRDLTNGSETKISKLQKLLHVCIFTGLIGVIVFLFQDCHQNKMSHQFLPKRRKMA